MKQNKYLIKSAGVITVQKASINIKKKYYTNSSNELKDYFTDKHGL